MILRRNGIVLLALLGSVVVFARESPEVSTLRKKADAGDHQAELALGQHYRAGDGIARDDKRAVELFRKAVVALPAAETSLGEMYEFGRGVEKDAAVAVQSFRRAAEQGDAAGMLDLALCLADGNGAAKDIGEAYLWVEIARKVATGPLKSRANGMHFGMRLRISKATAEEADRRADDWVRHHAAA